MSDEILCPFTPPDIIQLFPRLKHMEIANKDCRTYIQSGKVHINSQPDMAAQLLSQGMNILFQISGPKNLETASCMSKLSSVHFKFGDLGQALNLQSKACLIYRDVLGELHPKTAFGYSSLAMYYHTTGNFERGFNLMYRALYILQITCGGNHPDIASIYLNMGHMYQEIDQNLACIDSFLKALYRYIEMFGENHIQVALVNQFIASYHKNCRKGLEYQEACH